MLRILHSRAWIGLLMGRYRSNPYFCLIYYRSTRLRCPRVVRRHYRRRRK